jgi:hypothetical protein
MGGLHGLTGMASMAGPQGALVGTAASMGLSAIEGVGSAIGSMFSGPSTPKMPDDVNYACVADLQIVEQSATASTLPAPAEKSGSGAQPGIYQTRLAADVQITDRKMGKPLGQPTAGQATTEPRIQQMRMVGHVRQKD